MYPKLLIKNKNDGGRQDKSYGLRSGWISPAETPRCRLGSFLFIPPSKRCRNGYPIATESVLQSPICPKDSLGVFHNSPNQLLASFADKVSGAIAVLPLATSKTLVPPSPLTHARQATLHTAHDSAHRNAGSYQFRTRTGNKRSLQPSHKSWSPRKPGRISHAIGMRPESLTPSTHPKLGVKSRHQGLHRYALQRIFRPFLGAGSSD